MVVKSRQIPPSRFRVIDIKKNICLHSPHNQSLHFSKTPDSKRHIHTLSPGKTHTHQHATPTRHTQAAHQHNTPPHDRLQPQLKYPHTHHKDFAGLRGGRGSTPRQNSLHTSTITLSVAQRPGGNNVHAKWGIDGIRVERLLRLFRGDL